MRILLREEERQDLQDKERINKTKMKAILFDLDGTMVNSSEDIVISINCLREEYSLSKLSYKEGLQSIGKGLDYLLKNSCKELDVNENLFPTIKEKFLKYYCLNLTNKSYVYEGIENLLKKLKSKNIKIAVVTNKNYKFAIKVLEKFNLIEYFEKIYAAEIGYKLKPDPEMIFMATEFFRADLDEVYMIGDSWIDILTAKNAGCKSVFVNWGFHSNGEYKPDFFIKNILELEKLVLTKI